jgi:Tfp pilus assembly ATPase PilU
MPRRPLEEISVNIPYREELTLYTRLKIVTLRKEGFLIPNISTRIKISKSTVKKTVNADLYYNNSNSLRCIERPKKYLERDER